MPSTTKNSPKIGKEIIAQAKAAHLIDLHKITLIPAAAPDRIWTACIGDSEADSETSAVELGVSAFNAILHVVAAGKKARILSEAKPLPTAPDEILKLAEIMAMIEGHRVLLLPPSEYTGSTKWEARALSGPAENVSKFSDTISAAVRGAVALADVLKAPVTTAKPGI